MDDKKEKMLIWSIVGASIIGMLAKAVFFSQLHYIWYLVFAFAPVIVVGIILLVFILKEKK
jgi:hypothetical protein